MYLLDTSIVVAVIKDRPRVVRERLRQVQDSGDSVAVSSVVLFELWYGAAKSDWHRGNTERLRAFLSGRIETLAFDQGDAQAAGVLRATLERAGTPIGAYDLLIAGQALHRGATLVTANGKEFARVPTLSWEDWTSLV